MGWSTVELDGEVARRRLNDGREFEIVKRYYDPSVLQQELAELGWALDVRTTAAGLLIVGVGGRAATGGA
jgi:hypothetical protein